MVAGQAAALVHDLDQALASVPGVVLLALQDLEGRPRVLSFASASIVLSCFLQMGPLLLVELLAPLLLLLLQLDHPGLEIGFARPDPPNSVVSPGGHVGRTHSILARQKLNVLQQLLGHTTNLVVGINYCL